MRIWQFVLIAAIASVSQARLLNVEPASCVVGQKVPFLDEAARKPGFRKFRDSLMAAVRSHDVKALLPLISAGIKFSFGPDGEGKEAFLRFWKLKGNESAKSPVWDELASVLGRGGHWESNEFHFPYVVKSWPSTCDAYSEYAAVVGNASVHQSADRASPALTAVVDELVRLPDGMSSGPWVKVETADAKTGFVELTSIITPVGRRGAFVPSGKSWVLTTFVAGD